MNDETIDRIKYLSAKERLAKEKLIEFPKKEEEELESYKIVFNKIPKTLQKTILYMHIFLGINMPEISKLTNYSYEYVRHEYYLIKNTFLTMK